MEQAGFIVAIDLGTSTFVGVLARKNEQGVITILASESIPSDASVKYGVIYNIDEAAGKIKKLLTVLENKTGKKIGKVYVSISGKSVRAIQHVETQLLDENTPVTFAVIDKMEQQAKLNKPDFFSNYSLLAPEYYLDGHYQEDPIDKLASTIEGRYRLIVGRPNIKANLEKAITAKSPVQIAGYIVGSIATAALVLDEEDRQAGCALVDFGAGTTTVSVYKDGLLRHLTTIPFGGRTITKDVQELGFVASSAESYKLRYGKVGKDRAKPILGETVSSDVDLRELNKVIQLRQDEIILNVIHQIQESGYADELDAGIILVGGAAQLKGLAEHLADKAQMPVKKGAVKRVYINNAAELIQNPIYTHCLGLLLFANENCERKEQIRTEEPIATAAHTSPSVDAKAEKARKKEEEAEAKRIAKAEAKANKKPNPLFNLFEKAQNFGGTLFKEED